MTSTSSFHQKENYVWVWSILITIFLAEMLGYVWCRVQYIQTCYDITSYEEKRESLLKINNELKIEQARLKSPERIGSIATEQLHLIKPNPDQIKFLP